TDTYCTPDDVVNTNEVNITVHGELTAGTAGADQVICYGEIPAQLSANAPTGGSNTFTYQWQVYNTTTSAWDNIASAVALTYQPSALLVDTKYRLQQTDTYCTPDDVVNTNEVNININPLPTPSISGSNTVTEGATVIYQTANVSGHSYAWVVTGGTKVVAPLTPYICEVTWGSGPSGNVQVTETITATGCNKTVSVPVTITAIALKGTITYNNVAGTPMNNVIVTLKGTGTGLPVTTTTSPTGYYEFATVPSGATVNTIEVSTVKAWGGGNSTDALGIQRRAINNTPSFWNPANYIDKVGDVNNSTNVNATDALLVKQRAIQLVTSFGAGDWSFYAPGNDLLFTNTSANTAYAACTTGGITRDIKAMCYGDVNGSFNPSGAKSEVLITGNNVIGVQPGLTFELPVRVDAGMDMSALTLYLNYPENKVRVKEVRSELPGMLYTVADGRINIAWSEPQPTYIAANGTLITLVLETVGTLNGNEDLFGLSSISEFADEYGDPIDGVNLKIDRLDNTSEYGLNVYPNPLKTETTIQYTLPSTGKVTLTILDQYGKTITTLKNQTEETGNYTVKFTPASYSLSNGVYFCRIQVQGQSGNFQKLVKLVYIR
ncbi:MAG: T9SS type A sorting domain-containing protein, partial [Bacteroidales bacterium]